MADLIYNSFRAALAGDAAISSTPIDFEADTIKLALFTSTHTPSAANTYISDLTNEVAAGGGYSTGGATVTGITVTYSGATATITSSAVTWSTSTITARYAVLYKDSGTPTTSPLIALYDFTTDKSSSSGDFTVTPNASGLLTVT